MVSHLVYRYHELNDAHDSSMQPAIYTDIFFFISLVHANEPIREIVIDFCGFLLLFALVLILEACTGSS